MVGGQLAYANVETARLPHVLSLIHLTVESFGLDIFACTPADAPSNPTQSSACPPSYPTEQAPPLWPKNPFPSLENPLLPFGIGETLGASV